MLYLHTFKSVPSFLCLSNFLENILLLNTGEDRSTGGQHLQALAQAVIPHLHWVRRRLLGLKKKYNSSLKDIECHNIHKLHENYVGYHIKWFSLDIILDLDTKQDICQNGATLFLPDKLVTEPEVASRSSTFSLAAENPSNSPKLSREEVELPAAAMGSGRRVCDGTAASDGIGSENWFDVSSLSSSSPVSFPASLGVPSGVDLETEFEAFDLADLSCSGKRSSNAEPAAEEVAFPSIVADEVSFTASGSVVVVVVVVVVVG